MLKIGTNSSSDQNFANQPVTTGKIKFLNRQVFKVGEDKSHLFNKTIKLENGNPLKLSPEDKVFQFSLFTEGQKHASVIELPTALFTQARKSNKIFFSKNEKNYELELSPCLSWWSNKEQTYSFDECFNGIDHLNFTREAMFENDDVPKEYIAWGKDVHLSPKAKRIELGKPGCFSLNPENLRFISDDIRKCEGDSFKPKIDNNVYTVLLDMVGTLVDMDDQDTRISIDVIVDDDRLYVHTYPKEGQIFPFEKLYWINLSVGSKQIDKEAIIVTHLQDRGGILRIDLPLMLSTTSPKDECNNSESATSLIKETKVEEEATNASSEPNSTQSMLKKDNVESDKLDDEPSNDKCCNKCILQ